MKIWGRKVNFRLVWDLFMVWVALINLGIILFDLSYLWLRPYYYRYVPVVTRVYDNVKGIKPHPTTERLSGLVDEVLTRLEFNAPVEQVQPQLEEISELTARVLLENPFERSGQTRNLEVIRTMIAQETSVNSDSLRTREAIHEAVSDFWQAHPAEIHQRLEVFDQRIGPLLDVNYYRDFDLSGHLVDHFWRIDLPFLLLFWAEFLIRWGIAMRDGRHARWFFFPIFNWYDVLGLVPNRYFRPFRLLRAVSMYMRLRRSELSRVGKDVFSRGFSYISNIITEEISDMVSLRILNEYQEEIRDGTHLRIIEKSFGSRRREIEAVLATQIHNLLTDEATLEQFRQLLRLNLETAVESTRTLQSIPLPAPLVKPVVRAVGEVILETTLESIHATLESPEGQEHVEELVSTMLYQMTGSPALRELEDLGEEISIDVIEHMKEAVKVRKWAQPDPNKLAADQPDH